MLRDRAVLTAYRPRPPVHWPALAITIAVAIVISGFMWIRYSPCLPLVVWSSREKVELLQDLVQKYQPERVDRRCVRVDVELMASGAAEDSLASWRETTAGRPAVWLPAATAWVLLLNEDRHRAGLPEIVPLVTQSLIQSPLVIAMPEPMEEALRASHPRIGLDDISDLARDPQGWSSLGKPWGPVKLVKTTPLNSTSGLHTLISLNNVAQSADDPVGFLHDMERPVVNYPDSVNGFLEALSRIDQQGRTLATVSAIAVEEKQVFDYNRGNPSGKPCDGSCGDEPSTKLTAVYPKGGTLIADHPYVILDWPDQEDAAFYKQAALNLQLYLTSDAAQREFQSQGFRDHRGHPGDNLRPPYFDPTQRQSFNLPPPGAVIRDMVEVWRDGLRKRANAMLVIDLDRSHDQTVAGTKKLDLVKRGFDRAFGPLAADDSFGLRTIPAQAGGSHQELLPIARLGSPPSRVNQSISGLQTADGRPSLYTAIRAAADSVRANYANDRVNAVIVVTSGANDGASAHFDLMLSLRQQPSDRAVLVFVVATSKVAANELRAVTDESGGLYYDATELGIERAILNAMQNL